MMASSYRLSRRTTVTVVARFIFDLLTTCAPPFCWKNPFENLPDLTGVAV